MYNLFLIFSIRLGLRTQSYEKIEQLILSVIFLIYNLLIINNLYNFKRSILILFRVIKIKIFVTPLSYFIGKNRT
jgi:hypothetical protein